LWAPLAKPWFPDGQHPTSLTQLKFFSDALSIEMRRTAGRCGYFLGPPAISAAVAFVLGGETAIAGCECAPEASSGLGAAGVIVDI
jgi:hypothetical protein